MKKLVTLLAFLTTFTLCLGVATACDNSTAKDSSSSSVSDSSTSEESSSSSISDSSTTEDSSSSSVSDSSTSEESSSSVDDSSTTEDSSSSASSSEGPGDIYTDISITNKPFGNAMFVGEEITLRYVLSPEQDLAHSVTWQSDNPTVATVDQTGKVVARAEGAVIISVSLDGTDLKARVAIVVSEPVPPNPITSLEFEGLEGDSITLQRGETKEFTLVTTPVDCDEFELDWTYSQDGIVSVVEGAESYTLTATSYGTVSVTAIVKDADVQKTIEIVVTGDVDEENGVITEHFTRGSVEAKGTYYINEEKTGTAQAPIYNGAFFNVGTRVNTTTPGTLTYNEGAIEWTCHSPTNFERIIFWYNGEIKESGRYLAKIYVKNLSVTDEAALATKFYYGYRTKTEATEGSEGNDNVSYNHTKALATADAAVKKLLSISGQDEVTFSQAGETLCLEVRLDAAKWNGDLWFACLGGKNSGVTGKTNLAFEKIELIDETAVTYGANVQSFEEEWKDASSYSNDAITVAHVGDLLTTKDTVKAGELAPLGSTGKTLYWATRRIYKEGLAEHPEGSVGSYSKLLFTFKNIDASKSYEVNIPMSLYTIAQQTAGNAFDAANLQIKAYKADSSAAEHLLNGDNTNVISALGDRATLRLTIPANCGWDGTICIRVYNTEIETKGDSAKLIFLFDNVSITEGQA